MAFSVLSCSVPMIWNFNDTIVQMENADPTRTQFAAKPRCGYLAAIPIDAQKLMLFDVKKQTWQELAKMDVGFASWSANGKYLYFDTGMGKEQAIFRVRIADRKLERV